MDTLTEPYQRDELYLLAINVTKRCNLACAHCYLDADTLKNGQADELSVAEVNALLDEVASRGKNTMVVLTGGEPLARRDLEQMIRHGILAVEMEAAELYNLAARYKRRALAVLTVSDHLITGEALPSEDREKSFGDMVEIALEAAFS